MRLRCQRDALHKAVQSVLGVVASKGVHPVYESVRLAAGENDLTLFAGPVPDNFGLFFYGQTTTGGAPVGNGVLCLANPVYRSPIGLASGGLLSVPLDLASPPVPAATILPGSTWSFQAVFRDVPAGGAEFDWSDGVSLTFL